jgi:biopolymer transport protein ExbD
MSKRRIGVRVDMTPMVDIAFLLLIFYMATTQFKPPEARAVELPQSRSQIQLPDKDIVNITVTKWDSVYVDYVETATINIDGQDVRSNVRRVVTTSATGVANEINRARSKNVKALVVIKADKKASFGAMQDVMKQMQENSLERFLIITDKAKEKKG